MINCSRILPSLYSCSLPAVSQIKRIKQNTLKLCTFTKALNQMSQLPEKKNENGKYCSSDYRGGSSYTNTCRNIAKGTTDPRVEFILQVLTQILIKFHLLQNLEQVSTSKSQPNLNISTKVKLKNIDQTWLQNLDQDLTS